MLLFISISPALLSQHFDVSIHLMLLFIIFAQINCNFLYSFNTSHVTLYQHLEQPSSSARSCFNTSHVTLYLEEALKKASEFMFQYISCYSLSVYGRCFCRRSLSFNTSHVTLYQTGFQLVPHVFKFQYISCYSLSRNRPSLSHVVCCFNTSHVTLYRRKRYRNPGSKLVSIHLMLLFICIAVC